MLGFRYAVAISPYNQSSGPFAVWIPPTQVEFGSSTGGYTVNMPGRNLTLIDAAFTNGSATSELFALNSYTILKSMPSAEFSSSGVATMSLEPFGTFAIQLKWQWQLLRADGSYQNSSWVPVPPVSVHPDLLAVVSSFGPIPVPSGGTLGTCLSGPLANRSFELQIVALNPSPHELDSLNLTPTGARSSWCETLQIPVGTAPGPALFQLWDLAPDNLTFLLASTHFRVENSTSSAEGSFGVWIGPLDIGIGVAAGALAVATWIVYRKEHGNRPDPPSPSP
jgi:hypothetical protein